MGSAGARDVEVFTEAVHLPKEERSAFLAQACADDEELRRQVEALLGSHEQTWDFLDEAPTVSLSETRAKVGAWEKPGDRVGQYKLIQQIGEGGCGIVFLAEQEEPVRRRVALKLIKPGMDTKSVIARFEAERQALALMDHPNIAHVLEVGATQSGRPFFVMELVEGVKLTDYCDQRFLTTTARLELFTQVCEAVQHAHQKGIIHRDIKPSNILVATRSDGKALPKVIDFGIAKATAGQRLTDKTIFTSYEMLVGTPAYMSPEQASLSSAEIDTRTDIYSLGVLLYELLSGQTPFDTRELLKAGLDEVRRVIREEEPIRPSTRLSTMVAADVKAVSRLRGEEAPKLVREMRGDLDWIVMKALEKDRQRRYPTANALAMEIKRYLSGEAVLARPASASYKFRKLAARNKLLFSGVALIFALLVVSVVATSRWLMAERRTRQQMRQQLEVSRLERLGWELSFQGKYTDAEQMFRKSWALHRQLPGAEPLSAVQCNLLVILYQKGKRLEQIRPFLDESVDSVQFSRPEYCELFVNAASTLAQYGRWVDADALAERLQKSVPANSDAYHLRAPLLVAKNDVDGYRRLCGEIIARFSNQQDPYVADRMAKDCLILSSSGVQLKKVAALADVAITRGTNLSSFPYFQFCKALAEFRLGHYEEAVTLARQAAEGPFVYPKADAAAVVAMSQFKLNQLENARTALSNCNKIIEAQMPKPGQDLGNDWRDWIIARALQSESKRMIEGATSSAVPPANQSP